LVIRALRLLRITRVFKLAEYVTEANLLLRALHGSRDKIVVFLMTVLILDVILGSLMYVVESPEAGFDSIPRSVYWAIVTMTTVGYGDIAPETVLGQMIAAGVMILGYSIIAVPTGIVTAGIFEAHKPVVTTRSCPACTSEGHEWAARYCKDCGEQLLVAEREALAAEEE
jgi:voltage-gated potassium channel